MTEQRHVVIDLSGCLSQLFAAGIVLAGALIVLAAFVRLAFHVIDAVIP